MSENGSDVPKTAMQVAASLTKDVYQDALQPSMRTFGEALDGILKAVSYYPRYWALASDISITEKVEKFKKQLTERVSEIPEGDRCLPKPNIMGPAMQALEYAVLEDELARMFANLLASASDSKKADQVHPAFVEVLRQLSPIEAKIMDALSKNDGMYGIVDVRDNNKQGAYLIRNFSLMMRDILDNPRTSHVSLDNLLRLKLVDIEHNQYAWALSEWGTPYRKWFDDYCRIMDEQGFDSDAFTMEQRVMFLSDFGRNFIATCVNSSKGISLKTVKEKE